MYIQVIPIYLDALKSERTSQSDEDALKELDEWDARLTIHKCSTAQ